MFEKVNVKKCIFKILNNAAGWSKVTKVDKRIKAQSTKLALAGQMMQTSIFCFFFQHNNDCFIFVCFNCTPNVQAIVSKVSILTIKTRAILYQ